MSFGVEADFLRQRKVDGGGCEDKSRHKRLRRLPEIPRKYNNRS